MLRQERLGAGMADQKDLDAQYARAVMGDGKFQVSFPYCWLLRKIQKDFRMILITLMTMLRNWADKRCVLMP
jgi:hypothetical protein